MTADVLVIDADFPNAISQIEQVLAERCTICYVIYMYYPQVNPSQVWVWVWVSGYPSKNPYPFEWVRVFARCGCGYDL